MTAASVPAGHLPGPHSSLSTASRRATTSCSPMVCLTVVAIMSPVYGTATLSSATGLATSGLPTVTTRNCAFSSYLVRKPSHFHPCVSRFPKSGGGGGGGGGGVDGRFMFRISGNRSCQCPGPEHELQRQRDCGTEKVPAEVFDLDFVGLPV